MTAGSIVLAQPTQCASWLEATTEVYTDIFLGNIKNWNDPRIATANPGVNLPDLPIRVRTLTAVEPAVFTHT